MEPVVLVIGGPTAVGKTHTAIKFAQRWNAEIISADSRQCYRELTIGTAKPAPGELSMVPHHFINSHSISETFTAGDFYRDGRRKLEAIFTRTSVAVVTGGSGMYVKALLEGINEIPAVPESLRQQLNVQYREGGLDQLRKELEQLDPVYYREVDLNNVQRIIRALEVCMHTGRPFSDFRTGNQADPLPYRTVSIGLDTERAGLYARINQRVDAMVADGLLEEVAGLKPFRDHYALQTVGYKEIFDYFDGTYGKEEAIDKIRQNTRRYAKRQLTWFRKFGNMTWFDPENLDRIDDFITRMIDK